MSFPNTLNLTLFILGDFVFYMKSSQVIGIIYFEKWEFIGTSCDVSWDDWELLGMGIKTIRNNHEERSNDSKEYFPRGFI